MNNTLECLALRAMCTLILSEKNYLKINKLEQNPFQKIDLNDSKTNKAAGKYICW